MWRRASTIMITKYNTILKIWRVTKALNLVFVDKLLFLWLTISLKPLTNLFSLDLQSVNEDDLQKYRLKPILSKQLVKCANYRKLCNSKINNQIEQYFWIFLGSKHPLGINKRTGVNFTNILCWWNWLQPHFHVF